MRDAASVEYDGKCGDGKQKKFLIEIFTRMSSIIFIATIHNNNHNCDDHDDDDRDRHWGYDMKE